MRIIFASLLLLTLYSTPVLANNITAEMADKYLESCTAKERPEQLSEQSHKALCACTASKMLENMTTEDVIDLSNEDPAIARDALNYMLVTVYAPCMEQPTKDHYYHTCRSNPQTRLITTEPREMCECIADRVSDYIAKNGPEILADILTRNPNVQDPMGALENDPVFQNYVKKQGVACLF